MSICGRQNWKVHNVSDRDQRQISCPEHLSNQMSQEQSQITSGRYGKNVHENSLKNTSD